MAYKTVKKEAQAETEVKKSRFIALLAEVKTEEEAEDIIKRTKKKYYDASHTCSAYILSSDGGIRHSSDDGEPSGTAGKPMLDVLSGAGLSDVIVLVTRYFGGTLLGTGGLVRAYVGAAKAVVENAEIVEVTDGTLVSFVVEYGILPKLQHICAELEIAVYNVQYLEKVEISILLKDEVAGKFFKELTEATSGELDRSSAISEKRVDFYIENGAIILEQV